RARAFRGEVDARGAFAARIGRGPLLAVQRTGHDARAGRLPAAAWPGEQIRVVDPPGRQRCPKRFRHVVLANDLGKSRRTVFAIQGESHGPRVPPGADAPHAPGSARLAARRAAGERGRSSRPRVGPPRTQAPHPHKRGPPHPSEPAYPCCLPALGRFTGWTSRGSAVQCRPGAPQSRTAGTHFTENRLLRKSANEPPSRSPSGPRRCKPAWKARAVLPHTGTRTTRRRRPAAAQYSATTSANDCTRGPPMSRARPTGSPNASSATRPATCSTSIGCTETPCGASATAGLASAAAIRNTSSWNWVARCTVYGTPESAINRSVSSFAW